MLKEARGLMGRSISRRFIIIKCKVISFIQQWKYHTVTCYDIKELYFTQRVGYILNTMLKSVCLSEGGPNVYIYIVSIENVTLQLMTKYALQNLISTSASSHIKTSIVKRKQHWLNWNLRRFELSVIILPMTSYLSWQPGQAIGRTTYINAITFLCIWIKLTYIMLYYFYTMIMAEVMKPINPSWLKD